ncbi:MAG: lysophospholipid acyltransferase family protein [Desulfobacterales bacterium]|jgi:predicted LPLAT superfamily acyltransferase|nr:lysophospholipid acyltransferase family protein [Desulfobacterales bacterium]
MRKLFYHLLTLASKVFGTWVFVGISRGIAAGYFLLFPRRVAVGVRFYRALFPDQSLRRHLRCTWKQFQNFTSVFLDRYLLQDGVRIDYSFEGRDHLLQAMRKNEGGILLMTHMGNWEVAAHLLQQSLPELRLMLYMGQRAGDEIEHLQKRDLKAGGIHVLAVDREGDSPFALVEAVSFLQSGGFVSMAGDRIWRRDQRAIPVRFLGREVRLPEAPHVLALVSGAPLFIFFASKTGRRTYHFSVSPPVYVPAQSRKDRRSAIDRSIQAYANLMEHQLRRTPFEWYHFEPFLGPKRH